MSELWGYDHKFGWQEEANFLDREIELTEGNDIEKAIKALGYQDGFGVYQVDDSLLGNPIQVYEQREGSNKPKYLIEFCPTGGDISYFVARNMPSLIELLGKLTPLVQATLIGSFVDDINREKYK